MAKKKAKAKKAAKKGRATKGKKGGSHDPK